MSPQLLEWKFSLSVIVFPSLFHPNCGPELLLAFLSSVDNLLIHRNWVTNDAGKQEYSSRTLGATWGIISAVMLPIAIVLICIGWRILKRRKAEEKEDEYIGIKTRHIDPDESMKINSDEDDSIPYKKDTLDETPSPTEGVNVTEQPNPDYRYAPDQPVSQEYPTTSSPYEQNQPQTRQWTGETEIN